MDDQSRQIRRRLVKASLTAPAIFTLPSGAALAAVSLNCAAKSQTLAQAQQPPGLATLDDGWVRQRLVVHTATAGGQPVSVVTVNNGATWYDITSGLPVAVEAPPVETPQTRFALVDYADGRVAGVYPQQNPVINPIAGGSCWTSLSVVPIAGNILQ